MEDIVIMSVCYCNACVKCLDNTGIGRKEKGVRQEKDMAHHLTVSHKVPA